jgi:hypothetical protein
LFVSGRVPVESEDRIAHNETLFRDVNERIEAGLWPTERAEAVGFRCECGSLGCNMLVEATIEEYERVRASATHFLLFPGHEIPAIERVVDREAAFVVVEKVGEAADVAKETDPRDD